MLYLCSNLCSIDCCTDAVPFRCPCVQCRPEPLSCSLDRGALPLSPGCCIETAITRPQHPGCGAEVSSAVISAAPLVLGYRQSLPVGIKAGIDATVVCRPRHRGSGPPDRDLRGISSAVSSRCVAGPPDRDLRGISSAASSRCIESSAFRPWYLGRAAVFWPSLEVCIN